MPDRLRNLHPGALHPADPARRSFLLLSGTESSLSDTWPSFLCRATSSAKLPADLIAALIVGRALFLEIPQIDVGVQFLGFVLDLLGDFDGPQLYQRGAADGLLHPQLAPLHAAGQVHLALAGQQRYGAHFAQIHANRVVCVNRFLDGMRMGEIFAIMHFLRVEETAFLIERKSERLMTLA